ncbi:chromosome partition protein Smc-like isoform X2 [Gigantopelta aegis]|uniref:chromosome partition protein Smc-like isoform X2 n=1 Tax=Gigantopelta aegis TaxID=1735272 RepID=UPI001B88E4E7|nr:chromosome partition protein Smc-like isoform X2 [Gigantopelta aegis]
MDYKLCSPPKLQRTVHLQQTLDAGCISPVVIMKSPAHSLKSDGIKFTPLQLAKLRIEPSPQSSIQLHSQTKKRGYSDTGESIADIEGLLFNGAIDNLLSLPQEVSKVAEIQKGQSNEIQKQKLYLDSLQIQLKAGKESCDEVMAEISSVTRKVFVLEEQTAEEKKQIVQHEKEIVSLIHQQNQLRRDIEHKKEELEEQTKKSEAYRVKMYNYKQQVSEFENMLPAQQQLIEVEKCLAKLEKQKQALCLDSESENDCADTMTKNLSECIKLSRADVKQLETQLQEIKDKIHQVLEQQKKVKIATSVLNKRNAAQLTRLKRQLKEQQLRHRQWSDQHAQLLKSVNELTSRLDK